METRLGHERSLASIVTVRRDETKHHKTAPLLSELSRKPGKARTSQVDTVAQRERMAEARLARHIAVGPGCSTGLREKSRQGLVVERSEW